MASLSPGRGGPGTVAITSANDLVPPGTPLHSKAGETLLPSHVNFVGSEYTSLAKVNELLFNCMEDEMVLFDCAVNPFGHCELTTFCTFLP